MFWLTALSIQLCVALLSGGAAADYRIRKITEFPNNTWVENLAFKSDGQVVVTVTTAPEVYQIDPSKPNGAPKLVAEFPDSLAILGITELEENVFAVVRGNFTVEPSFTYVAGSWYISKVDLSGKKPKISTIAHVPQGKVLNGITTVKPGSKYLLIADSVAGVVWRLNTETKKIDTVLDAPATRPIGTLAQGGIGANGVHTQDGMLYFTNFNKGFYHVPIDSTGTTTGDVVKVATFIDGDDFALDKSGTAYVARGFVDKVEKVPASGDISALKFSNKNALELIEGSTAAGFGSDQKTLYVTTNGGLAGLVEGTSIHGGLLVAIDLE